MNLLLDSTPAAVQQMQSAARAQDWSGLAALALKHRTIFTTLGLLERKEQLYRIGKSAGAATAANSENINILLFCFARDFESTCAQVKRERDKSAIVDTKRK